MLAVADAVLKPHCEVYQVGSTTAIEILPGEAAQVLHADDTCYPSHLLPFEAQISALWALDDFTEENGATRIVLGSHRNFSANAYQSDENIDYFVTARLQLVDFVLHCAWNISTWSFPPGPNAT